MSARETTAINETDAGVAKADLHCHSDASQLSKLGVQRNAGLPECATRPEEVYEQAKSRGMDFVTITDHDTIDGVLEISDRPDVFISEELTAWFRNRPYAVHILCYGITPDDHDWLQAHSYDIELCADYLGENEITCALAHPFYSVEAPLTPEHRRRLARLFDIWETRNGSRAPELNMPASTYIDTRGGTGVGGSDDHAGVDIGRTFTRTPAAATPEEFLDHVLAGRAEALGKQGSAAKWAHAALGLAIRALLPPGAELVDHDAVRRPSTDHMSEPAPTIAPDAVLRVAERVVRQGSSRRGAEPDEFGAGDARALLEGWLSAMGFASGEELMELMVSDEFSHTELYRRARNAHDVKLIEATKAVASAATDGITVIKDAVSEVLEACLPVVPYAPAAGLLAGERRRLSANDSEPRRVAMFVDGIAAVHGVANTVERVRELGIPGFEVDVIGTDSRVDRRLSSVVEVEVPFYEGLEIGVPSIPSLIEVLTEGRYDLIHLTSPGPSNLVAAIVGQIAGVPLMASHHTELIAYAGIRTGELEVEAVVQMALSMFYAPCRRVLSPSKATDLSLAAVGVGSERIERWARGVDVGVFGPQHRRRDPGDDRVLVLYAGRLTKEKGADLLAEAFLSAKARDPKLHLVVAGGGPEEDQLRDAVGDSATFLGWQGREQLAASYASADIFLFPSETDTFGQVVVEAQASGLPVVAAAVGGPLDLINDGETGLLRNARAIELADAVLELADAPQLRRRIGTAAAGSARARTWAASMSELGSGYEAALSEVSEPANDQPEGGLGRPRLRAAA